jgi:murein L,D-transpeptidase YafK
VFKGERKMDLKRQGKTIRRYRVAPGFSPERHKQRESDGRTPEGSYTVDARNPRSAFRVSPGGDIYIHDQPNGWRKFLVGRPARDWTTGCVAVSDAAIREVWSLVPTGVRVVIHR